MTLSVLIALGQLSGKHAVLRTSTGIDVVLHCEKVTHGEYVGQERVSLITFRRGRKFQSTTLTHRHDKAVSDRIHVLGEHVVAEIYTSALSRSLFVVKVASDGVHIITPFKDEQITHFVGSGVALIGGCLVGCIWASPDLIPSSWGSYMFVVSTRKVIWGRLPSKDEGFEATAGEEPRTFKLQFWDSYTGWGFNDTYKWPPDCIGSEWQLVRSLR